MSDAAQHDNRPRLTIEDFTALNLLSPEEIANKQNVSRVFAIEETEEPTVASITVYEDGYSPKGLRVEYNLAAQNQEKINEQILEARIDTRKARKDVKLTHFGFGSKSVDVPERTTFELHLSKRTRRADYKNMASSAFVTVVAEQDPDDPNSFIVTSDAKTEDIIATIEGIRQMQAVIGQHLEQITNNPDATVTKTKLGGPQPG